MVILAWMQNSELEVVQLRNRLASLEVKMKSVSTLKTFVLTFRRNFSLLQSLLLLFVVYTITWRVGAAF